MERRSYQRTEHELEGHPTHMGQALQCARPANLSLCKPRNKKLTPTDTYQQPVHVWTFQISLPGKTKFRLWGADHVHTREQVLIQRWEGSRGGPGRSWEGLPHRCLGW